MDASPILTVRDLTTQFLIGGHPYTAVDRVSFDLYQGKTLALVGESGCGKSVTALSLLRILPTPPALPSTGQVLYKGQNLLESSEKEMRAIRGARIAMIFQDPSTALNPVYTVGQQLNEVAELHLGLYGEEAYARSIRALDEVGLAFPEEHLDEYPHQLSGGMKQRVMIAMALMCEPDILIADEPTTALDVTIQAQVLELIRNLQKKTEMALLLITHDLGVVAEMADEVLVMYASWVVESSPAEVLFNHPCHPYTQGLFQSLPQPNVPKGELSTIKGTVPSLTHFPPGCHFHTRCPYVMEKCRQGPVPNFDITSEERHKAKCWLYENR